MSFAERRKYPRVAASLQCQVSLGNSAFQAPTKNLSCGGALCQLSQPVPALTKLEVLLELPHLLDTTAHPIRCMGVVVRQEPPVILGGAASYLTAIFFSDIRLEDRRRIAEFVLQSMLSHDHRRS